ncbi:MAG: Smr/MutS family protein [Proteobacteria bacterium]|nr:Smr/MutS family protein [Pseudomonadota bacterium]
MSLDVAQKTLERLEWPQILAALGDQCRTPEARARYGVGCRPFARNRDHALALLAETSEARGRLDDDDLPPLGSVPDVATILARASKGGVLTPPQLRELRIVLETLREVRAYLLAREEPLPRLSTCAEAMEAHADLAADIATAIAPDGEIQDGASRVLAQARADAGRLAREVQERLSRSLKDPEIAAALSDSYVTVRNDRFVLPVKADARGRVRGIVHAASGSGTTLFVEPQAVVEGNNRLKQAELEIERETQRILRAFSERVAAIAPSLAHGLDALADVDAAFARARLSQSMQGVEPEVGDEGVYALPQLRHPLIPPQESIANDVFLGRDFHVLVLSGPNGGGKTVAMKAVALAALFAWTGLHVPAAPGARIDLPSALLAAIGDDQDIRESLSTFSAHMATLAAILPRTDPKALVVLDEVGVGTDPGEGAALAQAFLETLADRGARTIATTHYNLLKEMAEVDERFCNASVDFDPDTLAPTYRLRLGSAGASSATAVAARMGMPSLVLERAGGLLEREDRRLDRMLSELAASRAQLEREQREAATARAEGEAARAAYRTKLERLNERRDRLFARMQSDLEVAFRDAHAEVARVIRELQRGGTAQDAARARDQLTALASDAPAPPATPSRPEAQGLDWRQAKPGDPVRLRAGGTGTLVALPDRKGRARVQVGAAKISVPADQVLAATGSAKVRLPSVHVERAVESAAGGVDHLDLRGQRVEEALVRLEQDLDRAAADGRDAVEIIHGFGTGALREAVREHLARVPYVTRFEPGAAEAGGDGVTVAHLTSAGS